MIVNKLHYLWKKQMQYLHDNLKMHIVYGGGGGVNAKPTLWP
jgi:hypothetical protein